MHTIEDNDIVKRLVGVSQQLNHPGLSDIIEEAVALIQHQSVEIDSLRQQIMDDDELFFGDVDEELESEGLEEE